MKSIQDQYFDLLNDLRNKKEELADTDTSNLDNIIAKTNTLFTDITTSAELKLDAKISAEAVNLSSLTFEKKLRNRKVTTMSFINNLNKGLKKNIGDEQCAERYNRKMHILFGSLEQRFYGITFKHHYGLAVNDRLRRKREAKVEEQDRKSTKIEHKRIKDDNFAHKIDKITDAIGNQKIDYYRLVINPDSFTRTIENIFYLSFAIKLKKVKFCFENRRILIAKTDGEQEQGEKEVNHFISSIDYVEYKRIIHNLNIDKPFLQ
ncbi:hypothetical protein VCUG_00340 [Vavraia culicis subsp. floridensis]|uniref:Non-structural maintenance of chromosomes element 4 n=1 Tax=Vavraia culicis (isolate floridensis) TaxID=948595 RepID=L2GXK9_VAVCU|nr:uncharacterized protein VCUG_00340 [Vavraia culicis subsp. floridensis]ELA48102.1 hypothetical protein VCUG_00340 [Vavraia culicis subsp. floridensis]